MPKDLHPTLFSSLILCFLSCLGPQEEAKDIPDDFQEQSPPEANLTDQPFSLFLRVFKHEDVIEAWVKPDTSKTYKLLTTLPICRISGALGLNYPNTSDRRRGHPTTPGGDIFIHGKCVTVGCLPITNPLIETLYALAEKAKTSGEPIAVHIFPFRMDADYIKGLKSSSTHHTFWEELRPIYQSFEDHHQLPKVAISLEGACRVE